MALLLESSGSLLLESDGTELLLESDTGVTVAGPLIAGGPLLHSALIRGGRLAAT